MFFFRETSNSQKCFINKYKLKSAPHLDFFYYIFNMSFYLELGKLPFSILIEKGSLNLHVNEVKIINTIDMKLLEDLISDSEIF